MTTTLVRPNAYDVERAAKILDDHGGIPFGPRSYPCVCGGAKAAHAGPTNGGGDASTGCKRYRGDQGWEAAYAAWDGQQRSLGQTLRAADRILGERRRKANPVLPGQLRIGVSDLDTCPRALQYRNAPPDDLVLAPENKREALMGQFIHDGAQQRLALLYPWRLIEHEVSVPGLDRKSRCDDYDPIIAEVGDIKTAGDWRWDQLGENGPTPETWEKVQVYGLALREAGYPVKTVRLDYIKRCNGADETFREDYDEDVARAAVDRLVGYATSLDLGLDLPKTGTGPSNDEICRRCPFRLHCWNIPAAEKAGRSPESWTVLGPDPDEEAIAEVIAARHEAGVARRAAEKHEDETKSWLDGIEAGRYGEYEGYESGGGGGADHKKYAETLADELVKPPEQQRTLDAIEVPQKPRYRYMKWGPVRKATLAAEKRAAKAREKAAQEAATAAQADEQPDDGQEDQHGAGAA